MSSIDAARGLSVHLACAPAGITCWTVTALVLAGEDSGEQYLHRIALKAEMPGRGIAELHMVTEGALSGTNGHTSRWWPDKVRQRVEMGAYDLEQVTRACEEFVQEYWPHPMRAARILAAPQPQGRLF